MAKARGRKTKGRVVAYIPDAEKLAALDEMEHRRLLAQLIVDTYGELKECEELSTRNQMRRTIKELESAILGVDKHEGKMSMTALEAKVKRLERAAEGVRSEKPRRLNQPNAVD